MMLSPPAEGASLSPTGAGEATGMAGSIQADHLGDSEGRLTIGTWNLSGWSASKARTVFAEVGADVLAVQETHLAALPLQWAHRTVQAVDHHLLHGHPVPSVSGGTYGKSCGVGFVLRSGVAAAAALPMGAAWRWLHHIGRLHGIRLAPRPGLPRGLLLLSVYAPLQTRLQQVERRKFTEALLEVTHTLDLQVPTLLMGDFNGSAVPSRDFLGATSGRRAACPLLTTLLGPGGAWVDAHTTFLTEPLPWTFQLLDREGQLSASRIDLLLGNHAAMTMVRKAWVLTDIRDGGHSPVMVHLLLSGPVAINWQQPRARLPDLLYQTSKELRSSPIWSALLERWEQHSAVCAALDPGTIHSAAALSTAVMAALQHLVTLAGGWTTRQTERRKAYDSDEVRRLRRRLAELHHLEQLTRGVGESSLGSWPRAWEQLCASLRRRGLVLPRTTAVALRAAVLQAARETREKVHQLNRTMRQQRHLRWHNALPQLWQTRPGVVYHWLQAPTSAWGCTPIVDDAGQQCLTVTAVDRAVQSFWVDQVLRQHQAVDGAARWRLFEASEFYPHVPVLDWPYTSWTAALVGAALRAMGERSSPGLPNIPVAVWKALPPTWLATIARLLNLVEAEGQWPAEWLDAYVVMIPKAAGGSRPRDQRPITVLPLVYRIWAKGVTLQWQPVMQHTYLGQAAMGFRAQSGTLHVAQLLSDLIMLSHTRGTELWLVSFDIEKCYDSVPWWALFGMMRRTGIAEPVVRSFEAYYRDLRRHFRYGQVDGEAWKATNSLMQGCPASPDELNLLLEPFHRWAVAAGLGVDVGTGRVPSVSFADDVALVARDRAEAETLIAAYLRWCDLLQLKVTKAQLWSNMGSDQEMVVGPLQMRTAPTFKIVGVVLGQDETTATELHTAPRMTKALLTLQRLRVLELPSSICSLLWRTTVLPQALYGCEVRDIKPKQLVPLASGGKAALGPKFPLLVNEWRAPEVLMGPPLGDSMVQDPVLAMRERQLCWWRVLCNLPGLVGTVHRLAAWQHGEWREPTPSLAAALRAAGWRAQRNEECLRAQAWPVVAPEPSYSGVILLEPVDAFAQPGAVFTDGSVSLSGGAAAVQVEDDQVRTARIITPHSSTQCELVALLLALELRPPHILTDSLASLHMLRSWGSWSPQKTLQHVDRSLVRQIIHLANQRTSPPLLEKVKAHDEQAVAIGHPKAMGNDAADSWAKRAATEAHHPVWPGTSTLYDDPVMVMDSEGVPVGEIKKQLHDLWWDRRHRSTARARPLLERLYPRDVAIEWGPSTGIFKRPVVQKAVFIHPAAPAAIKWMARLRTGALATQMRVVRHGMTQGSTMCGCCRLIDEDDEHLLTGCTATGAADWKASTLAVWRAVARGLHVQIPDPPDGWLETHRFRLLAALLPANMVGDCSIPVAIAPCFLARLHLALAAATAERMRRRGELLAQAAPQPSSESRPRPTATRPAGSLPAERQLTVPEIRRVEASQRAPPSVAQRPPEQMEPRVPIAGEARRRWLRQQLLIVIRDHTEVCSPHQGVEAVALLELFERVTGEAFSDTPGTRIGQRVRGIAKVLGNISREDEISPPLESISRVQRTGRFLVWNRQPREVVDVRAWRRRVETVETRAVPVPRLRDQMASADAGLAAWIHNHRYLVATDVATGESGMALLLLWEVDHQRSFPTQGAEGVSGALVGFTKRLQLRAARDPRLAWLKSEDMAVPLAPGLAPTHHKRWSVRVLAPTPEEPQGWYTDFVARWRAYTEALVCPPGSRPMSEMSEDLLMRVRPELRQQQQRVEEVEEAPGDAVVAKSQAEASSSSTVETQNSGRRRRRATVPLQSPVRRSALSTFGSQRQREAGAGPDAPAPAQSPVQSPACTNNLATQWSQHSRLAGAGTDAALPARKKTRVPAKSPAPTPEQATQRRLRPREVDADPGPPLRRQCTLLAWLQPPAAPSEDHDGATKERPARHGRAKAGPPT